jgi:hypothetical protein
MLLQAVWYSSLVLAITSIASGTQLAVALSRLNSFPDGLERICKMLGKKENNQWRPRKVQLFILQIPISMQNTSIYSFVISMAILAYKSTGDLSLDTSVKVRSLYCY